MSEIETHPLTPFLPSNAKVLMLGSFPPPKSRWKMDFYYPNFNNDMWRIFGKIFFDDGQYFIDAKNKAFHQSLIEQFLVKQGVAIFDTAMAVIRERSNASDKFLNVVQTADIGALLRQLPQCQHIITTGEKACQMLLMNTDVKSLKIGQSCQLSIGDRLVTLHRVPSSSRAYPLALDKKVAYYQAVFAQIFDV